MDGRMDGRADNVKIVYSPQTKFVGGYNNKITHLVLRTRQIGHILINVNTSFRNTL